MKQVGNVMIHPVYQEFVELFEATTKLIDNTCQQETNKKYKTIFGHKNMRGIESITMAKWLLKNLPITTKARIDFFNKQVLKEEQKG